MSPSRYRRLCLLAEGGMGQVSLVMRQEGRFRRLYACKRPYPHLARSEAFRAMFMDEARVAGLLRHPNVVAVLDAGVDEEGPFLIMEYVEGLSAAAVLKALGARGEALSLASCLTIALHVARGLHAAHELAVDGQPLGLVHRDVAPANVLVGYDGLVRVADFGIAKATGNLGRTATGVLKGNAGYMAPEVLAFQAFDRRADLFSLGVVLCELLSGRRLFSGDDQTAARRILYDAPPDLLDLGVDLPPELGHLLLELLDRDPAKRPASAAQVADRIAALLADIVLVDAPPDLAAFMSTRFAEERRAHEARVEEALRAEPRAQLPRSTRKITWAVAAIGALAAGGVLTARMTAAPKLVPGLRAEYYEGTDFEALRSARVDARIDFDWLAAPAPGIAAPSFFSARWTGYLVADRTRSTRICVDVDDGVRLWLDRHLVLEDWTRRPLTRTCTTASLRAGTPQEVRLEYFQWNNQAAIRLLWEDAARPGVLVPVPPEHLFHAG